jgi:branched-chain amino acid transport system substrate-binding protein
MSARLLARGLVAAVALALAGCSAGGAATSSVTAKGTTLTIYLSAPADAASDPALADVLDAERLAFAQQAKGAEGHFGLRLQEITANKLSDNARRAIEDTSAIAYLGELVPGTSEQTVGITNAQDLLQVSPTDNALELTSSTPAVPGAPKKYYESLATYGRTFARVVPSSAAEARALLAEMQRLGVRSLLIVTGHSAYGAALAYALRHDMPSSITPASGESSADAVLYSGGSPAAAAAVFSKAAQANPAVKLFGPSALALAPGLSGDLSGSPHLYISQPGLLPSALDRAAGAFAGSFQARYGHAPSTEAVFGYEAMSAVLSAIAKAGKGAADRATVIRDFFAIRGRSSPLGTLSIDSDGDVSITPAAPFVIDRLQSGRLVPFAAVQG